MSSRPPNLTRRIENRSETIHEEPPDPPKSLMSEMAEVRKEIAELRASVLQDNVTYQRFPDRIPSPNITVNFHGVPGGYYQPRVVEPMIYQVPAPHQMYVNQGYQPQFLNPVPYQQVDGYRFTGSYHLDNQQPNRITTNSQPQIRPDRQPERHPERQPGRQPDRQPDQLDRPDRPDRPSDRLNRPDRPDRPSDRPERTDRNQPDRQDRPDRQPDRNQPDRQDRNQPDRQNRSQPDRQDQNQRDRQDRPDRQARPSDRPDRPDRNQPEFGRQVPRDQARTLTEKPTNRQPDRQPDRPSDRPERPDRQQDRPSDRPDRPDRQPERPEFGRQVHQTRTSTEKPIKVHQRIINQSTTDQNPTPTSSQPTRTTTTTTGIPNQKPLSPSMRPTINDQESPAPNNEPAYSPNRNQFIGTWKSKDGTIVTYSLDDEGRIVEILDDDPKKKCLEKAYEFPEKSMIFEHNHLYSYFDNHPDPVIDRYIRKGKLIITDKKADTKKTYHRHGVTPKPTESNHRRAQFLGTWKVAGFSSMSDWTFKYELDAEHRLIETETRRDKITKRYEKNYCEPLETMLFIKNHLNTYLGPFAKPYMIGRTLRRGKLFIDIRDPEDYSKIQHLHLRKI